MREIALFIGSLAGAAVLTALAVLIRPESPFWKGLLWGGIAVFVACACIVLFDYLKPGGKIEFSIGAGIGLALFMGFGIALVAGPQNSPDKPLRRLIAYSNYRLDARYQEPGLAVQAFHFRVQNVSDETITARTAFVNIYINDQKIVGITQPSAGTIIPQTQGTDFSATPNPQVVVMGQIRSATAEFEIDYDTIPETGVRRSYKKILILARPNVFPIFEGSATILEEWER
jgi:hypothetical protein